MESTTEQARAKVKAIHDRALSDPAFMQRAKADPAGVLREAGVPEAVIDQVVSSMTGQEAEVAGYREAPGWSKFLEICEPAVL